MDKLISPTSDKYPLLQIDDCGALLVEGIEVWIDSLIPPTAPMNIDLCEGIFMEDSKTGARFIVQRVKNG